MVEEPVIDTPDEIKAYQESLFHQGEITLNDRVIDINVVFEKDPRNWKDAFVQNWVGKEVKATGILFVPSGPRSDPESDFDPDHFYFEIGPSKSISFAPSILDIETNWHKYKDQKVTIKGTIHKRQTVSIVLKDVKLVKE